MNVKRILDLIGESIEDLHTQKYGTDNFEGAIKRAEYEAKLAKQFINGADVTLRADKMSGRTDRIDALI